MKQVGESAALAPPVVINFYRGVIDDEMRETKTAANIFNIEAKPRNEIQTTCSNRDITISKYFVRKCINHPGNTQTPVIKMPWQSISPDKPEHHAMLQ